MLATDITIDKNDPNYGPTYITIMEKATMSAVDFVEKDKGRLQRHERDQHRGHQPTSKELLEVIGVIHHRVAEDSEINICIRASLAGSKNPMRFGLRIEELGDDDAQFYKKNGPQPPMLGVDAHLTEVEVQMARIESNMHAMLSEADLSKERDSLYHEKTDAMHKATMFWPILHVGILLITGFTQANHIVSFFKTKRLI
jgi:hypothetical protein